ncbi:hypothetical protein [Pseudonocardia sp. GCM10023141]|uniref:hypothetical protein n=1 Tax=Pseudonocardia sp. GCM10023141 TaxID=3252653 RepID=UPI00361E87F2
MTRAALRAFGWTGHPMAETTIFNCRFVPVVSLSPSAHRLRVEDGAGPQFDDDTLAMWEWPKSAGLAPPPSAVQLVAALFVAPKGCRRRDLTAASAWRGFGPSAVLAAEPAGDLLRMEFGMQGIGLAVGTADAPVVEVVVPAAEGRRAPARRRVADRWVEESLYQQAIEQGLFDVTQGETALVGTSTSNQ